MDRSSRIEALQEQIKELRDSLPAHSVSAAALIQLEDLEEQLAELLAEIAEVKDAPA